MSDAIKFNVEQQQIYDQIITCHNKFVKSIKSFFKKLLTKYIPFFYKNTVKCGFYIYGQSGCGKTTLTNKICLDLQNKGFKVINMHFNDYFIDISRLLQKYNYSQIATNIASKTDILCFDEFFIESIADAKILQSLFAELFKCGVFIIATSNFSPDSLFKAGFNREVVFPAFSQSIERNLHVVQVTTKHDYRMHLVQHINCLCKTQEELAASLNILIYHQKNDPTDAISYTINDIQAKQSDIIGVFNYQALLKNPIGIRQIISIARSYHVICIDSFTTFSTQNEDEAIRFRDIVDMLYLRNCNLLVCTAKFTNNLQDAINNVAKNSISTNLNINLLDIFDKNLMQKKEFIRTYSRLNEMQSNAYITSHERHQKRIWCDLARTFFEHL